MNPDAAHSTSARFPTIWLSQDQLLRRTDERFQSTPTLNSRGLPHGCTRRTRRKAGELGGSAAIKPAQQFFASSLSNHCPCSQFDPSVIHSHTRASISIITGANSLCWSLGRIIGSSYSGTAVTQRLRVQPLSLLPLEPSDRHACSTEAVRCAELHREGQVWSNDWMCLGNVHGSDIRWLWRTQVSPRGRASCTASCSHLQSSRSRWHRA